MVDTLKSAASFLKSKWSKDQLTEALNSAMNDEDCQPSTNIMHQIANSSYSIDDWGKIWTFVQERLGSGKGVRVNKSLSVLEFLIKNGNEAIVKDLKEEIRLLRDLEEFTGKSESELRITSIRRKARTIIDLINSPKRLEEERAQADAIKLKMGTIYSNKNFTKSSNTSSKPVLLTKTSYDGNGSTYYSMSTAEKQESNLSKVTGMATNLMKGIANKFKGKQDLLLDDINSCKSYADLAYNNNPQIRPQMTPTQKKQPSKMFDKLNVRKPAGITKTHSNNVVPTPKAVRSEIKSQPIIPAPGIDFFGANDLKTKNKEDSELDIFGFGEEERKVSPAQPSNSFGLFGVGKIKQAKETTLKPNLSNDIFCFEDMNTGLIGGKKQQPNSVKLSSNFDIFSFSSEPTEADIKPLISPPSGNNKEVLFANLLF